MPLHWPPKPATSTAAPATGVRVPAPVKTTPVAVTGRMKSHAVERGSGVGQPMHWARAGGAAGQAPASRPQARPRTIKHA
jgi:hypothetical protein